MEQDALSGRKLLISDIVHVMIITQQLFKEM
jgi:hypothetical protein